MDDIKKAVFISAAFHILLLGIGLMIYYEVTPDKFFDQIEILDFRMEQPPTTRVSEYRPVRRVGEPAVRDFSEGQSSNYAPSRVDLPEVRTEFDDPLDRIDVPLDENLATTPIKMDDRIGNVASRVHSSIAQDALDLSASQIEEQPLALTGDDFLERLNSLIGDQEESPSAYYLEGEIRQRTIINEVIPEYPEGLQRNATVRVQFEVHPNGRVGEMVIVKKDEPVLEELSLQSLSQWRFNPIPQDIVQQGIITFIYRLK